MKTLKNLKTYFYQHPYIFASLLLVPIVLGVSFVQVLDRTKIKRKHPVEYIIVHYTANDSEEATAYLNARYLQKKRGAGTHYCIDDSDGNMGIIQCTKEENIAYAVGDRYWKGFSPKPWLVHPNGRRKVLNHNSLSYEMCLGGGRNDSLIIERTAQQVGWQLVNKGLDITRVLRHHDVTGKRCPYFNYQVDNRGKIDILKWDQSKEDASWKNFVNRVKFYQMIHLERKRWMKLR